MAIQMLRDNPAIASFAAHVAARDRQRLQDELAMRQRILFENQLASDEALRRGIGAIYAGERAGATAIPAAPLATQDASAPAPTPAPPMPPVARIAEPPQNPVFEFQMERPAPTVVPSGPVAGQPAAMPNQLASPPPSLPKASASLSASGLAGPAQSNLAPLMHELAKTPGTGAAMMQLFARDSESQRQAKIEQQRLRQEGLRLFTDASKNSDISTMRAVARNYDLGIPPEALQRREVLAEIGAGINTAKTLGITDDERAIAFAKGYVETLSRTNDPRASIQAGFAEAQKVPAKQRIGNYHVNEKGEIVGFTEAGQPVPTGVKARPLKWEREIGAGGAQPPGSKQREYAEWRIRTLIAAGMPERDAQLIVAGGAGQRPINEKERASLAQRLLNTKDRFGKPLYRNLPEAMAAVDEALGQPRGPTPVPEPSAGAPAPSSSARTPIITYDPITGRWSDGR